MSQAIECVFVLAALAAAWSDVRTRRIPNQLTITLIAGGLIAQTALSGWLVGIEALALTSSVIVAGSFVFAKGWFNGGDIKMIAAGAAIFGASNFLAFLLFTILAGGILSAVVALRQRRLLGTLRLIAVSAVTPGLPVTSSSAYGTVPYGIAIAVGALIVTLSSYFTGLRLPI